MFSDLQINYFPAREGVGGERQVGEKGTSVTGTDMEFTLENWHVSTNHLLPSREGDALLTGQKLIHTNGQISHTPLPQSYNPSDDSTWVT